MARPEAKIQDDLAKYLRAREWLVKYTHGSLYQSGFPDMFCAHKKYGIRWVEVKCPTGYRFTPAQLEFFPALASKGVGVWVLTAATDEEYQKLFGAANWYWYLPKY